MPGFTALASAPLTAIAQAQRLGSALGGLAFEGTASGGAAARVHDASGAVVWAGAAFGSASTTLRADDLLAVSGASATVGAARAGSDRVLPLWGHSTGTVHARLAAGSAFGLQAETHGAVRAVASITGGLVLSRLGSGDVDSLGAGARLLPLKGASVGRSAARLSSDQILNLAGTSGADAAIVAGAELSSTVTVSASASAAIGAGMQPDLTLGGAGFAISLQPLWARIDGALGLAGTALGHASTQAIGARGFGLTGHVDGVAGVTGASSSQVDMARDSAGLAVSLARVSSAISLRGRGDASVQPRGAASGFLPMSGSGRGWLPVNAQAASDHLVGGHGAGFVAVAGGASGAFLVTRALGVGVAIVSGAARGIPLLGKSSATTATRASAVSVATELYGTTAALSASSVHLVSGFDLLGQAQAGLEVSFDAKLFFAADLTASAIAPRQAIAEIRTELGGVSNARTEGSASALGPMQLDGTAASALSLTITAQGTIGFARSTLAVTQVKVVSERSIPFALGMQARSALSAEIAASLLLSAQGSAALAAHAAVNRAIDLAGATTTDAGVAAAGQTGFDLFGAAYAQASIGAEGRGAIARAAAAAVAETEIAGGSARSLHVAGSATGHILLAAEAIGGRVNLKLSAALRVDARAGAMGDVAFDAALRGQAVSAGATTGFVALTRAGAGDVAISSHSARVILFPGHASLAIASAGAANTPFAISPLLLGHTTIGAGLEQNAPVANGQGAAIVKSSGSARPGAWPMAGRSAAFRAPPALQRSEPPRTGLSGRLVSSNSGRILRG
jgi:hypothetical protein